MRLGLVCNREPPPIITSTELEEMWLLDGTSKDAEDAEDTERKTPSTPHKKKHAMASKLVFSRQTVFRRRYCKNRGGGGVI